MFRLVRLLLCAVVVCTDGTAQVGAQTLDGFASLPYLVETDPDAALDRIGAALDAVDGGAAADPRVIFDLYDLAADLLIEGGQVDQAAQIRARLAGFAVQYRDFLGIDPVPIHAEAAALLRDTGQLEAARDTLLAMYDEQRASGATRAALADTGGQIAQLAEALGKAAPDLPGPLDAGRFQEIPVFFATGRAESGDPDAALYFGGVRGAPAQGLATVSRPADPGAVDRSKLRALRPMAAEDWAARLEADPRRSILVYVHGAATGFERAARRAARISQALGGVDLPLLYSWPASGSSLDYMADSAAAAASARDLARALGDLTAHPGRPRLHLLAQGMGGRVLAEALELMAETAEPGAPPLFGQVIFAAPDIDADRFGDLMPVLRPMAERITLYTSDSDWDMGLARRLYGPALRAGWGGEASLTTPTADSVDLSALGGDMLVHPAALADLAMLLWGNVPPSRRCGLVPGPGVTGDLPVWRHAGGVCSAPALLGVLGRLRSDGVRTRDGALRSLEGAVSDPDLRARLRPVVARLFGG